MKQNKLEKLKQFIEDTLEQKKERRIKKRYIIATALFMHILALFIIFFFLEYKPQDYFSDLFKKPAKIKFEKRQQKFAQSSAQYIPSTQNKNQQISPQAMQKETLKQQAQTKQEEPKPIEPLKMPAYQGLNKPYMPIQEKKLEQDLAQEQDSGANKLFDTKKESQDVQETKKIETKPKTENKKLEKQKDPEPELLKQTPKEIETKEITPEKTAKNIQQEKPEKTELIEQNSLFLRKLKNLEKELEQNKLEREIFTQKNKQEKAKEIKKIDREIQQDQEQEIKELNKKNPRDFVVKKANVQDETSTKIKEYNAWNLAQNNDNKLNKNNRKSRKNNDNLTLADISKGFLDYTEQQGANLVQYTNAIEGAPTEEQLKHERYIRKIFDCIETTMKIKSNTLNFNQKVDPNGLLIVTVKIILENNGQVSDMKIMESSGFAEFDRFMLNTVNYSSKGFPPVPNYLSTGKYPLPVRFLIPVQMVASRF